MKHYTTFVAMAASSLFGMSASAQSADNANAHQNRFGISYRPGFNVSARFSGLGGFAAKTDSGPAAGGGINRTYDDGFNRVDSSGNAGGLTWNWGYSGAPGQLPGNDTVVMHGSSAAATSVAKDRTDDPQHGFELTYNRQLTKLGDCPVGLELAFNFTDISIRDNRPVSGTVTRISDAYSLGGITPPTGPYGGSFSGAGPMIGDSPSRSVEVVPGGALITGERKIDANIYGFRLGPYVDIPFNDYVSFSMSAGLALAVVNSDLRFNETVAIAGAGTVTHGGSHSDSDILAGGYFSGTLLFAITEQTSLFAGAQYQNVGKFSQNAAGKKAELDLGSTVFVTFGVAWTF